jgi:hypothetical protein
MPSLRRGHSDISNAHATPTPSTRRGTNRRYTQEVNARIVVVGLSTCAVGMLKALLLSSTANVKRVTLISEPGTARAPGVVVDEDYPEPFEFEALGLGQRLRVINTRAVAVDAEAKVVQLPDGAVVPYDILVLAHGLQESAQRDLVTKAGKDLLPDASDLIDWNSPEVDIVAELTKAPSDMEEEATDLTGFVSLSSDNASDELADAVSKLGDGSVVIVGGGLDALAAARRLLDLGVAASSIKIACENDQLEPLGDQVIDRVVQQSMEVGVEYGLKFAELVGADGGALTAARFARPVQQDDAPAPAPPAEDEVEAWVERPATPPPEVVDLPCGLVVGASTPAVAADAAALMDYPLTVDAAFKTCDDSIYAAGRHVAGQERYNSLELGACLAQSLLARLTDSSVEAPDFRKARAVSATLPGGLFYCRAALPTVPLDATALPTGMLGNDEVSCLRPLFFAFSFFRRVPPAACGRSTPPPRCLSRRRPPKMSRVIRFTPSRLSYPHAVRLRATCTPSRRQRGVVVLRHPYAIDATQNSRRRRAAGPGSAREELRRARAARPRGRKGQVLDPQSRRFGTPVRDHLPRQSARRAAEPRGGRRPPGGPLKWGLGGLRARRRRRLGRLLERGLVLGRAARPLPGFT